MNAEDAMLAKEMEGKRKRYEEQAAIVIRRRKHKVLGRPQERSRNFQIGG